MRAIMLQTSMIFNFKIKVSLFGRQNKTGAQLDNSEVHLIKGVNQVVCDVTDNTVSEYCLQDKKLD